MKGTGMLVGSLGCKCQILVSLRVFWAKCQGLVIRVARKEILKKRKSLLGVCISFGDVQIGLF